MAALYIDAQAAHDILKHTMKQLRAKVHLPLVSLASCQWQPILSTTRGPRKRPKMVGIGKSGFDSSSYAEFSQEHDQHLTLDVWWPNHE